MFERIEKGNGRETSLSRLLVHQKNDALAVQLLCSSILLLKRTPVTLIHSSPAASLLAVDQIIGGQNDEAAGRESQSRGLRLCRFCGSQRTLERRWKKVWQGKCMSERQCTHDFLIIIRPPLYPPFTLSLSLAAFSLNLCFQAEHLPSHIQVALILSHGHKLERSLYRSAADAMHAGIGVCVKRGCRIGCEPHARLLA